MANISHFTQTVNGTSTTYDIHDANAVPLAGTNALTGSIVPSTDNAYNLGDSTHGFHYVYCELVKCGGVVKPRYDDFNFFAGGTGLNTTGAYLQVNGKDYSDSGHFLLVANDNEQTKSLRGKPDGTLTWSGQPIQYISDQRYKQQIDQIDDKLLDAWEDVDLVQFKYNDAVDSKGDKARLHTGFVVQQIDSACKKHGVDISQYGLYCHEQYPEEVEEVEIEQADGAKTKEKKVIREASEHYSLRYTEALIVECKYLRRCVERLTARIEELEKGNSIK